MSSPNCTIGDVAWLGELGELAGSAAGRSWVWISALRTTAQSVGFRGLHFQAQLGIKNLNRIPKPEISFVTLKPVPFTVAQKTLNPEMH